MDEVRRRFLFSARQRVLDHLLSGWRRRGSSLLHIGLNGELSPECFWDAGFDVTALDRSPEKLAFWRGQTGPKVEYACGSPELLPFGDGEFDYAVLGHHGLRRRKAAGIGAGFSDGIPAELAEAHRVAARGIIVLEWNRFSLGGVPVLEKEEGEGAEPEDGVLPWKLWSLLGQACSGRRRHLVSSLPLWQCTWPCGNGERGLLPALQKFFSPLNSTPAALPFGAVLGVRVDWRAVPLTPAGVLRSAAEKLCPVQPREEIIGRNSAQGAVSNLQHEREDS